MRYYELSKEDKKKYGSKLLDIVERRRNAKLGADKIEDYILVELEDGTKDWIYYPDID